MSTVQKHPLTTGQHAIDWRSVQRVGLHGLLCRDGTYDAEIARSAPREYAPLPVQDRVVLDVGGNVGAFARHAALSGARLVVSIEPEASNYYCLVENTRDLPNVVTIRGCLGMYNGETEIWISPSGRNPGNTSQTQRRGRFSQKVPLVSLGQIMQKYEPQSVKLDCEGAEYTIGRARLMHDCVRDVVAEVHISGFGLEGAQKFCQEYTDSGWETTVAPRISPTLWHTIAGWHR